MYNIHTRQYSTCSGDRGRCYIYQRNRNLSLIRSWTMNVAKYDHGDAPISMVILDYGKVFLPFKKSYAREAGTEEEEQHAQNQRPAMNALRLGLHQEVKRSNHDAAPWSENVTRFQIVHSGERTYTFVHDLIYSLKISLYTCLGLPQAFR